MRLLILKYSVAVLAGMAIFVIPACDKEYDYDEIPYAVVNFTINPNTTLYWEINTPGGWVYLTANKPSRGVLVYRLTMDEFMAYERTCPYDPFDPEARIEVDHSSLIAVCPSCETRYILLDGTPFDGPGKRPLKRYRTSYDGNFLRVFN